MTAVEAGSACPGLSASHPAPAARPLTVLLTLAYFSLTFFTPLVCEGVDPAWFVAVRVQV